MAGITLAQAESNLQQWLDAQANISPTRSSAIGDRSVSYHDLDQISKMIDYWQRMVLRLSRGSGVGVGRVIVHD